MLILLLIILVVLSPTETQSSDYVKAVVENTCHRQYVLLIISDGRRYFSPCLWDIPNFWSSPTTTPESMFSLSLNSFSSSARFFASMPLGSLTTRTLSRS